MTSNMREMFAAARERAVARAMGFLPPGHRLLTEEEVDLMARYAIRELTDQATREAFARSAVMLAVTGEQSPLDVADDVCKWLEDVVAKYDSLLPSDPSAYRREIRRECVVASALKGQEQCL